MLNSLVLVVELITGITGHSLSLIMDGVHNLSDEIALAFLVSAYTLRTGISGRLLQTANLFNSVGLLAVCGLLGWQVFERLITPVEVVGILPIAAGLIGAVGNWGVARVLRHASREDAAIRLAYVHNLTDVLVSLTPVIAGVLIISFGNFIFDPIGAFVILAVIIVGTVRTIMDSHKELIWPENVSCGHSQSSEAVRQSIAESGTQ